MRYLIAFVLYLICNLSSASTPNYSNEIWVYTKTYLYFFQSCWTVVEQPDYLGNYCYGEFYSWATPSPAPQGDHPSMDVVIFAPDSSSNAYFVDENNKECYLFNKIDHGTYFEYFIQCGDYIFSNGDFEDRSGNPPGE